MKYLFATTNKAKIRYYATKLRERGIEVITLEDLNITCDVDETGKDPVENAIIKARAYYELSGVPTIALDDGLFLEGVPAHIQPGTHVRRVNGKRLNDKEMIDYYIGLVNQYGDNGALKGYFLKGVAIVDQNSVSTFDYKAKRCFTNKQSQVIDEGYPLASIQIISPFNKFKSELTEEEEKRTIDIEQKDIFEFILKTISTIEQA
ncbi:Non-canonical purine NTP pyrophosphatase [Clostridiales bacterium CHKCI006]|nr:Non-canonical purine NTP pyrophosphatase [Clostridiales bacterium CHKCI006]